MAELVIKVSEEKYRKALDNLKKQVDHLGDLKIQLENKKSQLGEGLREKLGQRTMELLDVNLQNVNRSIEKTNAAITQIENYLESMTTTESKLTSSVQTAIEDAQRLFD